MEDIRGSEFVQAVSEASSRGPTWVVVLLHKELSAACQLLSDCLAQLAHKYPNTKFVRIRSTDCIPNYPDRNLPTVLLYHDGSCQQHLVGLAQFGGKHATPEQVALVLSQYGGVCGEGEEEDVQKAAVKGLVQRLASQHVEGEGEGQHDESSDFED